MNELKISIIVPVFESAGSIGGCLESIAAQDQEGLEVIFVDDRGGDGSFGKVREFVSAYGGSARMKLLEMPRNCGPAAARNAGLEAAEGEYVAFLDSDDRIEPSFCSRMYSAAKAVKADIACCDIRIIDGADEKVCCNPAVTGGQFTIGLHKKYLRSFVSYFTTYIYRRSMLDEFGIRFPDTRSAEDSCFLACAIMAAGRIARVREALYVYEKNGVSVSGRRDRLRGLDRVRSFREMRRWARIHDMGIYRRQLALITLKKGWALAIRDLITG